VIVAPTGAALPAKAATTTIPIVFIIGEDPVRLDLVTSLARPSGNLTGINFFNAELTAKRLELLRALLPRAARVAVMVETTSPATETTLRDIEPAARAMGLQFEVVRTSTGSEINAAFATFASAPTHFSLPPGLFSPAGVSRWSTWRRAMLFPRHLRNVNFQKSAG
jgi:putative ABC transport system substrate-binding protein